jgi:hypothetical protein
LLEMWNSSGSIYGCIEIEWLKTNLKEL